MTLTMTPGIRCWEPATIVTAATGVRPAAVSCFFFRLFYVSALPGLSLIFPSITGDFMEIRQCFAWDDTTQVPTIMSRGPSPG
jgi:hypothetical protein